MTFAAGGIGACALDKPPLALRWTDMRAPISAFLLVLVPALFLADPAAADSCGDLIDRVVAETQARLVNRTTDFAELGAADGIGMTLACGDLSATGVQYKGTPLPAGYFALVGRAGHAVTGLGADSIAAAATKAHEAATTTRHSKIDLGAALVTCSVSEMGGRPVTACAVIQKGDRT